ncbi:hypothetical protein BC567DRAFT_45758 [Phyllosticta citribraziliensis]
MSSGAGGYCPETVPKAEQTALPPSVSSMTMSHANLDGRTDHCTLPDCKVGNRRDCGDAGPKRPSVEPEPHDPGQMRFDILKRRYLRLQNQLGELKEENAVLRTNNASLTRMVVEGWGRIAPVLERATDLEARFEERVSNLEARSFVELGYY